MDYKGAFEGGGAGGGLLPLLGPVSFRLFFPPPCIFTPVGRHMPKTERSVTDDAGVL